MRMPLPADAIGRMTLAQLVCLASPRPPGLGRVDSIEGHEARLRAEREAEAAWLGN